MFLEIKGIKKSFGTGDSRVNVLKGLDLEIERGEFCHEALSCLANFESLNLTGKAIQDSEVCIIPLDIARLYLMKDNEFLSYIYEDLYNK